LIAVHLRCKGASQVGRASAPQHGASCHPSRARPCPVCQLSAPSVKIRKSPNQRQGPGQQLRPLWGQVVPLKKTAPAGRHQHANPTVSRCPSVNFWRRAWKDSGVAQSYEPVKYARRNFRDRGWGLPCAVAGSDAKLPASPMTSSVVRSPSGGSSSASIPCNTAECTGFVE